MNRLEANETARIQGFEAWISKLPRSVLYLVHTDVCISQPFRRNHPSLFQLGVVPSTSSFASIHNYQPGALDFTEDVVK